MKAEVYNIYAVGAVEIAFLRGVGDADCRAIAVTLYQKRPYFRHALEDYMRRLKAVSTRRGWELAMRDRLPQHLQCGFALSEQALNK